MQQTNKKNQAGFSLMELVVALTITLVVMSISVTLLARTLNIRTRENEHVDELGDVQRALNIMSREIANSGFNLTNPDNGIVAADSNGQAIRIRANLNKFDTSGTFSAAARKGIGDPLAGAGEDAGEDADIDQDEWQHERRRDHPRRAAHAVLNRQRAAAAAAVALHVREVLGRRRAEQEETEDRADVPGLYADDGLDR